MTLKTVERPAFTVIGMNIRTRPMSSEIHRLWPVFVARIPEIENPSEPNVAYGVMRHEAGTKDVLHYMAAVAVATPGRIPKGMESFVIPPGTFAVFKYPLSGLSRGFGEIFNRLLPSSDYVQVPGPYFERYGESFKAADSDSPVEIYLPVRRRGGVVSGT